MTHPRPLAAEKLKYVVTAQYPCSYIDGELARSQVLGPGQGIDTDPYAELAAHGFRRNGLFIYRPQCDNCRACLSVRVPVADFKPNRSQMRAWKQHAALTSTTIEPVFSAEHYALYTRYQKIRHTGGGMDVDDEAQYTNFLVTTNVHTCMVEFRQKQPDKRWDQLKMVSTIDRVDDGLSAVYTFYDVEPGQNFGTFNILWQIELARSLGLRYLYLGYWIASCAKMSYKTRFKPCELLINGKWEVDQPSNFTK